MKVSKNTCNANDFSLKQNQTNIWCFETYDGTVTFWTTVLSVFLLIMEKGLSTHKDIPSGLIKTPEAWQINKSIFIRDGALYSGKQVLLRGEGEANSSIEFSRRGQSMQEFASCLDFFCLYLLITKYYLRPGFPCTHE